MIQERKTRTGRPRQSGPVTPPEDDPYLRYTEADVGPWRQELVEKIQSILDQTATSCPVTLCASSQCRRTQMCQEWRRNIDEFFDRRPKYPATIRLRNHMVEFIRTLIKEGISQNP